MFCSDADAMMVLFKTLLKGKNAAVWRVSYIERGKFDFDHYFAFLADFLKR